MLKGAGGSPRLLALALMLGACQQPTTRAEPETADPSPAREAVAKGEGEAKGEEGEGPRRVDVHIHLVEAAVDELVTALDRLGIARAVVMASPHLDPDRLRSPGGDGFAQWREANEGLLRQTAAHKGRLLPFVTVEPATVEVSELQGWLEAGACGVKLYMGHHDFHARALGDPAHEALFTFLEERRVPVLMHVNTFRYEDELDALLATHPDLELVCPHLCGSRTDLDRLERLLAKHPKLRVDTSHGPGKPGIDGFLNLEKERERLRALIHAQPQRFLFGSDLVTVTTMEKVEPTRMEWDLQVRANLGLLEAEEFEFRRPKNEHGAMAMSPYRGLALPEPELSAVLAGNAEAWLASCSDSPAPP